jgi:hypothetical protein
VVPGDVVPGGVLVGGPLTGTPGGGLVGAPGIPLVGVPDCGLVGAPGARYGPAVCGRPGLTGEPDADDGWPGRLAVVVGELFTIPADGTGGATAGGPGGGVTSADSGSPR